MATLGGSTGDPAPNLLYYGDNLAVLGQHLDDETVDLIYLDPPFNSNADYNVFYPEPDGGRSAAQIAAFKDTWEWDEAAPTYYETVESGTRVGQALRAFRQVVGEGRMLAYLSMIAPRLHELHRVLKPTGSLYLHCDPTASHYLKLLLDATFGAANYRNEIVWKRTSAHNDPKRYGRVHDVLLYYAKDAARVSFAPVYVGYDPAYLKAEFRQDAEGRWYKLDDLTAPGHGGEGGRFAFRGRTPGPSRMWRFKPDELERLWAEGRIKADAAGVPLLRGQITYLDEKRGMPVQDWWGDILRVGNTAKERLGYQTQKPLALLERIIRASSAEGDTVLDPFCGCGTAIDAAQRLGRCWIGIDITVLATNIIRRRLEDQYGPEIHTSYEVRGLPRTPSEAAALAAQDKYQFQWWALDLVGARPAPAEQKKGADRGIDGRLFFHDEGAGAKTKEIILSVKGGHSDVTHVRDLRGVLEREQAQIGVLITLHEPTAAMRKEAASGGAYYSPGWDRRYPRLQILTIQDLLGGAAIDYPPSRQTNVTFRRAPRTRPAVEQQRLRFGAP